MVVRELLARFGIDFDTKQINAGAAGIEGLISNVRKLGAAVAGSAVVVGITRFVDQLSTMGAELQHVATMLGMSAAELYEWQRAAEISGASAQDVTSAIQAVQAQMKSVLTGGEDAIRMFSRLGVNVYAAGGGLRSASSVFEEVAGKLGEVSNETERALIGNALLGGSAANLHGLFRLGADGIAELRSEVSGLAAVDMQAFTDASNDVRGALSRWGVVLDTLKMRLAIGFFPAVTAAIEAVSRAVAWFRDFTQGTHALEAALLVVTPVVAWFARAMIQAAIRIAIAWAPLLLKFALIAAAVAAVVLIVDDLITLFSGGRSVIGDFLDELFGVGAAEGFVRSVNEAVEATVEWLGQAWETAKEWGAVFLEVLGDVASFLSDTFGPAFEAAKGYFSALLDLGLEVAESLKNALVGIWGFVVDEITTRLGNMRDLVVRVAEFFGIDFDDVKEGAKAAAQLAAKGLEASFNVGTGVVTAATGAMRQINQRTEIGQIVVQGTADAEETARLVQERLRAQQEADLEAAHADLVPVGA